MRETLAGSRETLFISGMDCADCVRTIERDLSRMDGVQFASADLIGGRLDVEFDAGRVSLAEITRRVEGLGYGASMVRRDGPRSEWRSILDLARRRENLLAIVAALLTLVALPLFLSSVAEWLPRALLLAAIITGGVPLALKGMRSVTRGRSLDINVLMTIAVIGALAIGEWTEAAIVVVLFALSEALESYAMDRTRRSIQALMNIAPDVAFVSRDGQTVETPVEQVGPGEIVIVRPGDRVPLDGVVIAGDGSVDESPLTGESLPVGKSPDDQVFAGTLNGPARLTVRVSRPATESSVVRIIELIEQAQARRAPVQRLVDRFAAWYTPSVVVVAALVATVPPLLGASFGEWLYRALVLLVIACPCALVISTPVSVVSALAAAARRGILIKGGAALERAADITTIAFDKTGTLTSGAPRVIQINSFNGLNEDQLLATAASLEQHSSHPLGRAIVAEARARMLEVGPAEDERALPGFGVTGRLNGHRVRIGSRDLFAAGTLNGEVEAHLAEVERRGGTAVLVGDELEILGVIGLADTPRSESSRAIEQLREAGIERIVILSGDSAPAANEVAAGVGVDDVRAGLLPGEKLDAIDGLRRTGVVAMVGDGINDAPALASADLGIAMGAAGSDAALETADIALMGDDLTGLSRLIDLSRRARRTIRANIAFAIGTKAIVFALALGGIATLWLAVLADVGAALIVIANGLRLLRR